MNPQEQIVMLRNARWYGQRSREARAHGNERYANFCANKARKLIDAANGREGKVNEPKRDTHCQICERAILARTGHIAHHGYQRPHGSGYQTQSCPGARHLPYEQSREAIPPFIARLEAWLAARRDLQTQVEAGTASVPNPRPRAFYKPDPNYKASFEPGDASYERARSVFGASIRREIADATVEIKRLRQRYDSWPGARSG